jgi:hypothetical protein
MTSTTDVSTYICVRLTLCFLFFFFEVLNDVHIRKCMVRSTYVVWILNWTKRWRTSLRVLLHNWPQRWRTSLYVVLHKASLSTYTYVIKKLSINVPSTYALKIFNWRKRCSSIYKWMVRSTYVILWILNWRKRSRTSLYTVLHKASPYVNVYTIAYWFVQRKYVVYIRTSYVDIVCFGMCMGVMLRFVFA